MALVYLNDKGEKQRFALAGRTTTTIGREATCDLVLADRRVSRVHATIELCHGQHLLRDNASSNGTFLNGLRLNASHAFALRGSDTIEIGSERLRYVRSDAPGDTPAAGTPDAGTESFDAAELIDETARRIPVAERARLQTSILAVFAGAPGARGIQASLPLLAQELGVRSVAAFRDDARAGVRAVAAVPAFESASALLALAQRCARDQKSTSSAGSPRSTSGASATRACRTRRAPPPRRSSTASGRAASSSCTASAPCGSPAPTPASSRCSRRGSRAPSRSGTRPRRETRGHERSRRSSVRRSAADVPSRLDRPERRVAGVRPRGALAHHDWARLALRPRDPRHADLAAPRDDRGGARPAPPPRRGERERDLPERAASHAGERLRAASGRRDRDRPRPDRLRRLDAHSQTPFEDGARFSLEDLLADGTKELSSHDRSALDLAARRRSAASSSARRSSARWASSRRGSCSPPPSRSSRTRRAASAPAPGAPRSRRRPGSSRSPSASSRPARATSAT